ncbi:MAG: choice-of-anchor J domain-containing protein [Lachnospiraceae bacterium]|nr:choice-of-anchor J domain-containing protein [Lachnospiraceae bacterium]
MKRKMRRLLAMLLAFTLTFTVASTDVLAAGLEMAGEESVISAPVAGTVEIVEDAVEAGEAGSVVAEDAADAGEVDDAYVKEGVGAADAGEAGGVEAADAGEADGVDAEDGADAADADQAGGADAEDGADADGVEAADADQADGADAEDGADADGVEAADADQADGANAEDGVDTADAGEAEGAEEAGGVDAVDAGEAEGGEAEDGSDIMTEVGSSPRLRSFGAPKSLSLSSTGFSEGFEGDGIPEGWTVETDTEGYEWSIVASNYHSGSKSAKRGYVNGNGQTTWLITPAFDFSGITGILKLSFWYRNTPWNGLFEELSVCWRVDGGEWQELSKTESGHADWTKQVLYLPENAKKANVEISFKCVNHNAYGLYLDDVLLETASEIPMYTVTYYANGGTGTVTDLGSPYGEESTVTVLPNGFTTPPEKYFLSWNTEADGSGTKYEPGDSFVITGDVTLYAKWAQQLTNGLEEGFDGTAGIPEGWRQEKSDVGYEWIISTNVKHSGSGAAYSPYRSGDGQTAWLIMPMFDLRNVTGVPRLSFWYGNSPDQDGRFDDLGVCWRVNGGEWQELFMTESAHADWTKQVLALPADVKTANLEIAFKSVNHNGNGVCVDDVSLEFVSSEWFQVTYQANGGTGTMTDESNPYLIGQVVTVLPNGFSVPAHKFFTGWNTKADGSGTTYYPGNDFEIAGNVTLYAQWFDGSSGLNESFEATGLPGGWTVIADNEENQWFTGKDLNYGIASPFGKQMAIMNIFNTNRDGTSWLISPAMDLSGAGNNWILSFWYCNPSYNDAWFDFETYYRVNGGEWKKLFQAGEGHGDWTEKQILLPEEAKAANVEIGFKALEAYSYGVYLDGVVLRKVNGSIYTISTSDEISGGSVKTDLNLAGAGETVTLTVKPNYLYTLQTLTVKKGSVSVATIKVDETTYTFVMPEGNVTVEATFQPLEDVTFYEDFEGTDLSGWTFVDANGDGLGWYMNGFSDKQDSQGNDYTVSGDRFLCSASYDGVGITPDNWAITPAIQVRENATVSFWIKGVDPDYAAEIMAVYVGTGANVESMTKVGGDYTAAPAYEQYTVDLSAYAGQTVYIGFRHYNVTDMFVLALEDVLVKGDGSELLSVSYDANGGSGDMTDPMSPYIAGKSVTVLSCGFTAPSGKTFTGWNTKADGSGTAYVPGEAIQMNEDVVLYAQWVNSSDFVTFLEEGFEGGTIPEGWSVENDDDRYEWVVTNGDPLEGNYDAYVFSTTSATQGKDSWLITPTLDLSNVSGPARLSFMVKIKYNSSFTDKLSVCYRVDGGTWQVLYQKNAVGNGETESVYLPEEAKAANVEFAFKANDGMGNGIWLDQILLTGVGTAVTSCSVTYDANGGSGETVDLSSPYQMSDKATVMPNLFTAPEGKIFDSWNTKADGSGTKYHPAQTFTVTRNIKLYAQWKTIPTMPARLEEGFEGGVIPSGWKIEGDENYQWTVGTGDQKTETGAHSGEKNALIKHQSKGSTAWLVTPAMNLSHSKDAVLKFWYVNRKWGSDIDEFTVCYRVDKGEWKQLFHTSENHQEWTEQVIRLPEGARAVNVEFGFKALDKWGYGIGLDDVDVRAYEEPVYLVTTGNPENGTITANKEGIHKKGDIVVLTVTPNNGYKLAEILLTTYGEYPKIFKRGGNEYGFLVTDDDVTVSASFVPNSETVTYELWVGGTQVSESNAGNILGNGAASYDAITKTLTLNMDVENNDVSGEYKDAITSYVDGLVIKTTKSLKLSSAGDDAMELNGFTTIETNGLLTLEGATSKGGYGIFAQAPMVIRNSRIAASGRWGIRNEGDGMIRVLNSAITVQGTEGAMGPIELEDCQVLSPANGEMGEDGYVLVPNGSLFSYPREMEIGRVISVTADTPFAEDFEDGKTLEDWKFVEADDDGELWHQYSNQSGNVARSGIGTLTSASYSNRALTPDNWAFTPALKLPEHAVLSFWIAAQNPSWPNERMAVYVSSDRNPESATMLGGEYLATKDYAEYVIDLSDYAGQTVFLAFRHFNTYDQYRLNLDDVTVKVDESALTDNNLTIAKKSLTLQDTIAIDFKVAKSAIEGKYQDPYLVVTQNGEESIITKWEPNDDGTLMIFSYRVAPHNMRDVVTAVPHALNANGEDVTGVSVDYSVTDYCYNMLGKDTYQTDAWAPFRRLLVDILLYGDAAQKYVGYKTTELPSWKLTSAQRAMGTNTSVTMVYNNVKDVNFETVNASDEKAKIVTAALYLEASVNIQFKFTADDLTGLKVVVTDGENVLETLTPDPSKKDSNGRYYVTFGKLNAGQMRKTVYATVMQGTKKVSNTMQYSIESYAAAQSNSTVANLPELLHAMMRYGDSAKAVAEMLGQ